MIKSMTGYGRSEVLSGEKKVSVEIKSVNHKYMDVSVKMPRKLIQFEPDIRNVLKEYAARGKFDIFIAYEDSSKSAANLKFNPALAKEYYEYYKQIGEMLNLEQDIHIYSIARSPEVLALEDEELCENEVWPLLENAIRKAFENFRNARIKEGEALKKDILLKLDEMSEDVAFIEQHLPKIIEEYKEKLKVRVTELLEPSQLDEGRIAAEVTIYADKVAVDEELVRLKTHIKNMKSALHDGGEKGRNLDFLAQEMNRESNTILSKSNNIDVTNRGINLKTCIEKIREQVQNIE